MDLRDRMPPRPWGREWESQSRDAKDIILGCSSLPPPPVGLYSMENKSGKVIYNLHPIRCVNDSMRLPKMKIIRAFWP